METKTVESPIRFGFHGLSSPVTEQRYGEIGRQLMHEMRSIVRQANLKSTSHEYWVYLPGDEMFVGVEIKQSESSVIPDALAPCSFELQRYAKHIHIGPYDTLPQKWHALMSELADRGETVTMPSLEIYGDVCAGDESKIETTILLGLK